MRPRSSAWSAGKPGLPITPNSATRCSTTASTSPGRGAGRSSALRAAAEGFASAALPVLDMIEVRLATRAGWPIATSCAIMPPIDAPTTCARAMPSASIRPTVSAAMSSSAYGDATGRRSHFAASASIRFAVPPPDIRDDRPLSRLSKRITRKPSRTSPAQNGSGQAIDCMPSPMISTIAGARASPSAS